MTHGYSRNTRILTAGVLAVVMVLSVLALGAGTAAASPADDFSQGGFIASNPADATADSQTHVITTEITEGDFNLNNKQLDNITVSYPSAAGTDNIGTGDVVVEILSDDGSSVETTITTPNGVSAGAGSTNDDIVIDTSGTDTSNINTGDLVRVEIADDGGNLKGGLQQNAQNNVDVKLTGNEGQVTQSNTFALYTGTQAPINVASGNEYYSLHEAVQDGSGAITVDTGTISGVADDLDEALTQPTANPGADPLGLTGGLSNLEDAGAPSVDITGTDGDVIYYPDSTLGAAGEALIDAGSGITIDGLDIRGDSFIAGAGNPAGTVVSIDSDDVTVQNSEFRNAGQGGNPVINFNGGLAGTGATIDNNVLTTASTPGAADGIATGVALGTGGDNTVTFTDNTIDVSSGSGIGIDAQVGASSQGDLDIVGNENGADDAIKTAGGTGIKVQVSDAAADLNITSNDVDSSSGKGVVLDYSADTTYTGLHRFDENTITASSEGLDIDTQGAEFNFGTAGLSEDELNVSATVINGASTGVDLSSSQQNDQSTQFVFEEGTSIGQSGSEVNTGIDSADLDANPTGTTESFNITVHDSTVAVTGSNDAIEAADTSNDIFLDILLDSATLKSDNEANSVGVDIASGDADSLTLKNNVAFEQLSDSIQVSSSAASDFDLDGGDIDDTDADFTNVDQAIDVDADINSDTLTLSNIDFDTRGGSQPAVIVQNDNVDVTIDSISVSGDTSNSGDAGISIQGNVEFDSGEGKSKETEISGVDDGLILGGSGGPVSLTSSDIEYYDFDNMGSGAAIDVANVDTVDVIRHIQVDAEDDNEGTALNINDADITRVEDSHLGFDPGAPDEQESVVTGIDVKLNTDLDVANTSIGLAEQTSGDGIEFIDPANSNNLNIDDVRVEVENDAGKGIDYNTDGTLDLTADLSVSGQGLTIANESGLDLADPADDGVLVKDGDISFTNDQSSTNDLDVSDTDTGLAIRSSGELLGGSGSDTITGLSFDRMGDSEALDIENTGRAANEKITLTDYEVTSANGNTKAIDYDVNSDLDFEVNGDSNLGTDSSRVADGIDIGDQTGDKVIGVVTLDAVDINLANGGGKGVNVNYGSGGATGGDTLDIEDSLTVDGPSISGSTDHAGFGVHVDAADVTVQFTDPSGNSPAANNLDISGVNDGLVFDRAADLTTSTGGSTDQFSGSTSFSDIGGDAAGNTEAAIELNTAGLTNAQNFTDISISFTDGVGVGIKATATVDSPTEIEDVDITGDASNGGTGIEIAHSAGFKLDEAAESYSQASRIENVAEGLLVSANSELQNGDNTIRFTEFTGISGDGATGDGAAIDINGDIATSGGLTLDAINASSDDSTPAPAGVLIRSSQTNALTVQNSDLGAGGNDNNGNSLNALSDGVAVTSTGTGAINVDTNNDIGVQSGGNSVDAIRVNDGSSGAVTITDVDIDGDGSSNAQGVDISSAGGVLNIDNASSTPSTISQVDKGIIVSGGGNLQGIDNTNLDNIGSDAIEVESGASVDDEVSINGIQVDSSSNADAIDVNNGKLLLVNDSGLGNDTGTVNNGIVTAGGGATTVNSVEIGLTADGGDGIDTTATSGLDVVNSLDITGDSSSQAAKGINFDGGALTFSSNADQNLAISGVNTGIDVQSAGGVAGGTFQGAANTDEFTDIGQVALNIQGGGSGIGNDLTVDTVGVSSSSGATAVDFSGTSGNNNLDVQNSEFGTVNVGIDAQDASSQFNATNNTITVADDADAIGIRVDTGNAEVGILRNTIESNAGSQGSGAGVALETIASSQKGGSGAGERVLFLNNINGFSADGAFGLNGSDAASLSEETAVLNYWGSSDGPRADGGSNVVVNVDGEQAGEERIVDPILTVDTATVLERNNDQAAVEDLSDITVNNIESFAHTLTIESGDTAVFPGESDRTIDEALTGSNGVVFEFNESTESYDQITDLTRKPNALDDIAFAQQADTQEQLIVEYDNGTSTPTTKEYHTGINVVATLAGNETLDNGLSTAEGTGAVESTQTFSLGTSDLNTDENVTIAYDDEAEHAPYDQSARTQAINASLYDDSNSAVSDEVSPFGVAYIFIDQDDEDFYQSIDRTTPESADQVLTERGANKNVYDFEKAS